MGKQFLFESAEERHATLQNMTTYGGSFVVELAVLFYKADMNNKRKIMDTWPELFEKYSSKNWN